MLSLSPEVIPQTAVGAVLDTLDQTEAFAQSVRQAHTNLFSAVQTAWGVRRTQPLPVRVMPRSGVSVPLDFRGPMEGPGPEGPALSVP